MSLNPLAGFKIPAISSLPIYPGEPVTFTTPQPIMQFKELEVDRVRYDAWRASLSRPKPRKPQWRRSYA